jgi:hypothetical protein
VPVQAVAIVVYEGVQALDVAGPIDVFSEANTFVDKANRYETVLVAAHRDSLRASNGIRLVADLTFEEASGGWFSGSKSCRGARAFMDRSARGPLSLAMPVSWTIGESQPIGRMHRRWRPGSRRQKSNRT